MITDLDIEAKSALIIRYHPDGNQTLSIKVTIAIRLKINKQINSIYFILTHNHYM
jgi:hypothetical protein